MDLYDVLLAKKLQGSTPIFSLKGSVQSVSDLPSTGNNVGDVYIVTTTGTEYVWTTSTGYPNGYWEELGSPTNHYTVRWTVALDGNNQEVWSCNATYDDITAAHVAGKQIVFTWPDLSDAESLLALAFHEDDRVIQKWSAIIYRRDASDKLYSVKVSILNDDTIGVNTELITDNNFDFPVVFSENNNTWSASDTLSHTIAALQAGKKVAAYVDSYFFGYASMYGNEVFVTNIRYSGGSADPVLEVLYWYAIGQFEQIAFFEFNIAEKENFVNVLGATVSIAADDNSVYKCGELSALTVSSMPSNTGMFEILFKSGSTATTVTVPQTLLLPDGFAFEANTIYDISVRMMDIAGTTYGLAAVQGWPVPSA